MNSKDLRKKFLKFFEETGHKIIAPASLIPENDPTVLFTTAGMHPLVPFLMGEKHPEGNRLANCQPCIRTDDIDEVGDTYHHTFFEMLGNWSLGDYFKKEAIEMSVQFLTLDKWLGIDKDKLAISIFKGEDGIERDKESEKIWEDFGFKKERIKGLGKKDNWWGPAGQTGPCGPDTEMFYWVGKDPVPKEFDPDNKLWVEIWNDVFMEYFKNKEGEYENLTQKNVDTGMGLERMLAALNGLDDNYKTDVFLPIVKKIEELSGKKYEDNLKEFRVISDHIKAAVFIIGDRNGVEPSNLGRGYIVRRLLRRAIRYAKVLGLPDDFFVSLIKTTLDIYKDAYPEIKLKESDIITVFQKEAEKFEKALEQGLKEFEKGTDPFVLYSTYGFPLELTEELAKEKGIKIDKEKFRKEFEKHQELSRTASAGMFKGGLADDSEQVTKYHTATHLLLAALRKVLGGDVVQKGSNITAERIRFDFSYPQKMTKEQIKEVEDLVNEKIKENLDVRCQEMTLEQAKAARAMGVFESKYGEKVKVYSVGDFSKEICGGPHVEKTGELGIFEIKKEESSSSGIRRIKAILHK